MDLGIYHMLFFSDTFHLRYRQIFESRRNAFSHSCLYYKPGFRFCILYNTRHHYKSQRFTLFFTVYLKFVINEFNRHIITEKNEFVWTVVINVIITLIFTAISVFFYLKEYDRQSYRLERERQRREEMEENNEKA